MVNFRLLIAKICQVNSACFISFGNLHLGGVLRSYGHHSSLNYQQSPFNNYETIVNIIIILSVIKAILVV